MRANTISQFAANKFAELNELRRRNEAPYVGPKANTLFRKHVMCAIMEHADCSLSAAASHYNSAFRLMRELNAELVSGLGREEDKKGGRKRKPHGIQHKLGVEHIDDQMGIQQF